MRYSQNFLVGVFLLIFFIVSCGGNTTANDDDVIDGDVDSIVDLEIDEINDDVDEDIVVEDDDIIDDDLYDDEIDDVTDGDIIDDESDDLPEADLDEDLSDDEIDDDFVDVEVDETPDDDFVDDEVDETPDEDIVDFCKSVDCGENGTCNTETGTCDCESGFDGESCTDIDECTLETHDCTTGQDCLNIAGSFTCEEIDGCMSDPCFTGVECTDKLAPEVGYTCSECPVGYLGDGETCTEIPAPVITNLVIDCSATSGYCMSSGGSNIYTYPFTFSVSDATSCTAGTEVIIGTGTSGSPSVVNLVVNDGSFTYTTGSSNGNTIRITVSCTGPGGDTIDTDENNYFDIYLY